MHPEFINTEDIALQVVSGAVKCACAMAYCCKPLMGTSHQLIVLIHFITPSGKTTTMRSACEYINRAGLFDGGHVASIMLTSRAQARMDQPALYYRCTVRTRSAMGPNNKGQVVKDPDESGAAL